ncbi:TIGR03749 family integrating conjugative element protein [Pasteurella oralis]|uniref:TIGR03749 family integrating conjugative element protein n=1 Tax=Pasteurella oralis TaxID=1071947 RepID=UPI000C7AA7A9|nr:TIGR03749 family integrating conjugative element protein [Pasteurella oralis]
MKKTLLRKPLLCTALFFSTFSSFTYSEILMQWNRTPLKIDLNVNEERIIFVDKNVAVGIPSHLNKKLQVQSTGGAVYLKALETFDFNRVQLRDETGQLILLDLRSNQNKEKLDNIRITFDESIKNNIDAPSQVLVSDSEEISKSNIENRLPAPAALTRYAAQSLYAPLRTIEPLNGVHRVAMKLPKNLPTLLPNLPVKATPLESWGLGEYIVTAIKIQNKDNYKITLDPRYLQGKFYSATFQHSWLGPTGTLKDTTAVYIVTEGDISKAIIPAVPQKAAVIKKTISRRNEGEK